MSFKLAAVSYRNALPLLFGLEAHCEIVRAVPSQLSPLLRAGACDAALLPVVGWFRGAGEEIVSDACIGATGDVRSVLLFHRGPVDALKNIALDSSSRTSVALLHIVLHDLYGVSPNLTVLSPDLKEMLHQNDGALLIGDAALEARAHSEASGAEILDLGEAWQRLTGLPFVFAAWITRRGLLTEETASLSATLASARNAGLQNLDALARAGETPTLSADELRRYFSDSIDYVITDAHRAGLEEFRRRCVAHNLV
ncbi:MAG TPA: menaquinone biosynthesis protein [Abditibacteriaceae bacterium]|jgi:chorismate dehydratase